MFIFGLVVGGVGGLFIGWFLFPRPQWATDLIDRLKSKVGL